MKKMFSSVACFLLSLHGFTQTVNQSLQQKFTQFANDSQLKHAISSLYVIDAKTGKVVFDKNSQVGLAPASTQKIVTSVTAFETLGKDFRYSTVMGYLGKNGSADGGLYWNISGDPTFGSWRYASTKPEIIFAAFADSLRKHGVNKLGDHFMISDTSPYFDMQAIPDGWIMQDIGNYYGAGSFSINWKENQYEVLLRSENVENGAVDIVSVDNRLIAADTFINQMSAGPKGSGDNAYIYFPSTTNNYLLKGTIPINEKKFSISGAVNNGPDYFINDFRAYLKKEKFIDYPEGKKYQLVPGQRDVTNIVATYYSPSLDSIIYWFLKKSINLYGEAILKTFGITRNKYGSTEAGVYFVREFWKAKGLDEEELNIVDGSGLSPLNRVTTHAQVEILKYAKTRNWFSSFYDALPDYNGMKMKSGTISGVKGFCGYHTSKDGKQYVFSFLVNNYNGPSSSLVNKMYKVLDGLK